MLFWNCLIPAQLFVQNNKKTIKFEDGRILKYCQRFISFFAMKKPDAKIKVKINQGIFAKETFL
jgi:hypothetical protein